MNKEKAEFINEQAEIIQEESHNMIDVVFSGKENISNYQDVTNVFFYRKLAEMQYEINKLKENK